MMNEAMMTLGMMMGLLEAWTDERILNGSPVKKELRELSEAKKMRLRDLMCALPAPFIVQQMHEGYPSTKKFLLALSTEIY